MPPSLKGLKSFFARPAKPLIKLSPLKVRATGPKVNVPSLRQSLREGKMLSASHLYPDPARGRMGEHPRAISSTLPKATSAQQRASTSFGQQTMTPVKDTPGFPPTKAGRPDLAPMHTSYAVEKAAKHPQRIESPYGRSVRIEQERKARAPASMLGSKAERAPLPTSSRAQIDKLEVDRRVALARQRAGSPGSALSDIAERDQAKHAANIKKMTESTKKREAEIVRATLHPTTGKPHPSRSFASGPEADKLHAERKAAQVKADAANDARLKAQLARQEGYKAKEKAETLRLQRQKDRERERQRSLGSGPDPRGSAFEAFGKKRR